MRRRALLHRHKELALEPEEPPSNCDGIEEESAAVDVVASDAVAAIVGTRGVPLSLSLSLSRCVAWRSTA